MEAELATSENYGTINELVKTTENGLIRFSDYEKTKAIITELAKKYSGMVVVKENMEEAKKARAELRTTRTSLDKISTKNTRVLNSIKDEMKQEISDLISITDPVETHIDNQIKEIENAKKREKEEAERLEAERVKKIEDSISLYRTSLTNMYLTAKSGDTDIDVLVRRLEDLKQENFEEFQFEGEKLYVEFETKLPELREFIENRKKEQEELAELKRKSVERDKQKAKEDAELEAERKKLREEREQFQKEQEAQKEREAAVEFEKRKIELINLGYTDDKDQQVLVSEYMNIEYSRIKSHTPEQFQQKLIELQDLKNRFEEKVKREEQEAKERAEKFAARETQFADHGFGFHENVFRHPVGLVIYVSDVMAIKDEDWSSEFEKVLFEINRMETDKKEKANLVPDGKVPFNYLNDKLQEVLMGTPEIENTAVKDIIREFSSELLISLENLRVKLGQPE